jgi:hypothetical protein
MDEKRVESAKAFQGNQIREAVKAILGHVPKSVSLEFEKGGALPTLQAQPGEWSGNIYQYSY